MPGRFEFALSNVAPSQWEAFEALSSKFLSDEFPGLRTVASPRGDKGRDAQIHRPDGDPQVVLQFSVATDWSDKIRATVNRVSQELSDVRVLIFVSPRRIGAEQDGVVQWAWAEKRIRVEVRDQSWFVEREFRSKATMEASEALSRLVVDPLLRQSSVIDPSGETLSGEEARAALLYLVLQRRDDEMDRQLTRLCYDGLVRAILRHSDNDHRVPRSTIHQTMEELLPTHDADGVRSYADRALARLEKVVVRHWKKHDEFCLTYAERTRLDNEIADLAMEGQQFDQEIEEVIAFVAEGMEFPRELVDVADLAIRVRRVLERFLFERGEGFVRSLRDGQMIAFTGAELDELASNDFARHPDMSSIRRDVPSMTSRAVERLLLDPSPTTQYFLRSVADGYTLFAFLRETPNVQSAVTKLFANGEFWLDTSALLPLLAEELLEAEERSYTRVIHATRGAGASLYVTSGVLEELNAHLDNCVHASRAGSAWRTRTPFLFAAYLWSGRTAPRFREWLQLFRGSARPLDDIAEYLNDIHGIRPLDLGDHVAGAPPELRWAVEEYWTEVHEARRSQGDHDPEVIRRLASHDAESFLGIILRRHGEEIGNPFGYSAWWLTMDGRAFTAAKEIRERSGLERLDSPALSFDFLTYYLSLGPARRQLDKQQERALPLLLDTSFIDALPDDLASIADEVRDRFAGDDDRVIRRRIRDHLDQEKMRQRRIGRRGIEALEEDIRMALTGSKQPK